MLALLHMQQAIHHISAQLIKSHNLLQEAWELDIMGLQDLSVETVVVILRSLEVQDILNLRCVCRKHHTA
ncbi:hypothetical protein BDV40DRAFT_259541 [Aspergillus tamarii]|uniref:F-box domain-containing protein n=1 Tax=Aspergillus tamarii TaxID=41984 RepID=A0A5N6V1Y5_ASPTM|nr:hypothetical protein BDV40DRAFT_259541 [Aspergillus tamarii]